MDALICAIEIENIEIIELLLANKNIKIKFHSSESKIKCIVI